MISERVSDSIPPKYIILNMVIHILMHFRSIVCKPHKAARHPTKCVVINDVKTILDIISQNILSQIVDFIQSDVAQQKQVH